MAFLRHGLVALAALAGLQTASAASISINVPSDSNSNANASTTASAEPRACNNSPNLCGRSYSNVTFMGAHDSAFLRDASTGNSLAGNQYKNATLALDAGLRLLQAQVHLQNGQLRLCHTACGLLDAGLLDAWLTGIDAWMVQHPNDVVTVLLVNSDNANESLFAAAFESSGLAKLGYVPSNSTGTVVGGEWPTLDAMISKGQRLVAFVTNIASSPAAPYLLPEFDYVFETPFTVTDIGGFNCTLDRPSNVGTPTSGKGAKLLGLVNHFKDQVITSSIAVPDVTSLDVVNSADTTTQGSLGTHLTQCRAQWGRQPNFALVDFWDVGATVKAADDQNGIQSTTGRSSSDAATSTAGGGNNGSAAVGGATMRNLEQGALIVFLATALLML